VQYFLNELTDELALDVQEELGLANYYYFLKTCEDRKTVKGIMRIVVGAFSLVICPFTPRFNGSDIKQQLT
jgi:hypothetical protein